MTPKYVFPHHKQEKLIDLNIFIHTRKIILSQEFNKKYQFFNIKNEPHTNTGIVDLLSLLYLYISFSSFLTMFRRL